MHELIFVGDIAIPNDEGINIHLPDCLKNKEWVVNLEGAITDTLHDDAVYNNTKGFKKLLDAIPIKVASLANNHIFDIDALDNTISELQKEKILFLGAGKNLEEASRHINFGDFLFLNFGWSVIQCPTATKTKRGTNPYKEEHILKSFEECKLKFPKKKIVLLFHWNYEMELYPMPRQRDLALKLIDLGAEIIVGNHSHLVQGIEKYKDKYICHGLGNWAFRQGVYHQGKLSFLDSVLDQIAIEYSQNNDLKIHRFLYNKENNSVDYIETISSESDYIKSLTPYAGMSSKEYELFFRKNRLKTKGLPIYKSKDSELKIQMKNTYMKFRDLIIKIIFSLRR